MNKAYTEFERIFSGRRDFYGSFTPETNLKGKIEGRSNTRSRPVMSINYENHLKGNVSLGICPIDDDDLCWFGAIDVDEYGEEVQTTLLKRVEEYKLPLLACSTKSGGLHLYAFFKKKTEAKDVQEYLKKCAAILDITHTINVKTNKLNKTEIFPKQIKASPKGSWINLPYFGGERPCLTLEDNDLVDLTLEEFLLKVDTTSISEEEVQKFISKKKKIETSSNEDDLHGAPPCIIKLLESYEDSKVYDNRNEVLFALAVYAKKRSKLEDNYDWQDQVLEFNDKYFQEPLNRSEIEATIFLSHEKTDYNYSCSKDPWCSICDKVECCSRTYGIRDVEDPDILDFGEITIRKTSPETYLWNINSKQIEFLSKDIFNYTAFKTQALSQGRIVIPGDAKMKDVLDIFRRRLQEASDTNRIEHVDFEDTPEGLMLDHLYNFITLKLRPALSEKENRDEFMCAIVNNYVVEDDTLYYFRSQAFESYLDEKRFKDLTKEECRKSLKNLVLYNTAHRKRYKNYNTRFCSVDKQALFNRLNLTQETIYEQRKEEHTAAEDRLDIGTSDSGHQ